MPVWAALLPVAPFAAKMVCVSLFARCYICIDLAFGHWRSGPLLLVRRGVWLRLVIAVGFVLLGIGELTQRITAQVNCGRLARCYYTGMSLPFDSKHFRAYEIEFGAGGQRLGCKFMLDDGSVLFVNESEIKPEIETLMASLGSPTDGLRHGAPMQK